MSFENITAEIVLHREGGQMWAGEETGNVTSEDGVTSLFGDEVTNASGVAGVLLNITTKENSRSSYQV